MNRYLVRMLCALVVAALPAALDIAPTSAVNLPPPPCVGPCNFTFHFTQDGPFPVFVNCSADPGFFLVTETGNDVFHVNVNAAQDYWITGTDTGSWFLQPVVVSGFDQNGNPIITGDDASRPTASGTGASWFGLEVNNLNATSTGIVSVHFTTSTGVSFAVQMAGNVTLSANGVFHTQTEAHC
jgi:hypothetical protein